MKKYRKKPVVIEAIKWTGYHDDATHQYHMGNAKEIVSWADGDISIDWTYDPSGDFAMVIDTLEGKMHVSPGDYIIKGIKGEFYPCKPDIFALTYEDADQTDELEELKKDLNRLYRHEFENAIESHFMSGKWGEEHPFRGLVIPTDIGEYLVKWGFFVKTGKSVDAPNGIEYATYRPVDSPPLIFEGSYDTSD